MNYILKFITLTQYTWVNQFLTALKYGSVSVLKGDVLEMYVRPFIKYVCFRFFCVLLAFSLFLLFNASVFCFLPFFIMNARWVTIWLRLAFCAICFYYVAKRT